MAKRYRVEAWTGPSGVGHYAQRMRDAGFTDVVEGTERVYGTTSVEDDRGSYDARLLAARTLFNNDSLRLVYSKEVEDV